MGKILNPSNGITQSCLDGCGYFLMAPETLSSSERMQSTLSIQLDTIDPY
jgi:hypothetical protein